MGIYFHADNQITFKLLERLGFSADRIISKQPLSDEELRERGVNPEALKVLADPKATVHPTQSVESGDFYLSVADAERAFMAIEEVGGLEEFKRLTRVESPFAQPGQLRFFLNAQVLREGQWYPNHGCGNLGAYATAPDYPYDPSLQPIMHGAVFPAAQLPDTLRTQALPALINIKKRTGQDGALENNGQRS